MHQVCHPTLLERGNIGLGPTNLCRPCSLLTNSFCNLELYLEILISPLKQALWQIFDQKHVFQLRYKILTNEPFSRLPPTLTL